MRALIAIAAVGACGRLDFDARRDASRSTDAADAADVTPVVFAYAFDASLVAPVTNIAIFNLDPVTGGLSETPSSPFALGDSPTFAVANTTGTALYVASVSAKSIFTLRIDPLTGALAMLGRVAVGVQPVMLALHPDGKWLYVCDQANTAVHGYAIQPDDTLVELTGSPWMHTGSSTAWAAISPAGDQLYALDENNRGLYGFAIQADGSLVVEPGVVWATGDVSPHVAVITPNGNFGFIAPDSMGSIPAFTIDPATKALSTTPGSPFASTANTSLSAVLDQTGTRLYMANDGDDTVNELAIDATTGAIADVAGSPITLATVWWVAVPPIGTDAYLTTSTPDAVLHLRATPFATLESVPISTAPKFPAIAFARTR